MLGLDEGTGLTLVPHPNPLMDSQRIKSQLSTPPFIFNIFTRTSMGLLKTYILENINL